MILKVPLRTLENDPFKFLSSTVTFENKPQDHLVVLKDKISCKLAKLDNTLVRPEVGGRRKVNAVAKLGFQGEILKFLRGSGHAVEISHI